MFPVRDETTIEELRSRAIHRKVRLAPVDFFQRAEQSLHRLKEMLKSGTRPEPYQTGRILGEILNDAFDAAEDLGLDPAGCMTLAEAPTA